MTTINDQELVSQLTEVFCEVFDDEITLSDEMVAADVDGWDSLGHIRLVVAVEGCFSIKFTSSEINSWENVGAFIACIRTKLQ